MDEPVEDGVAKRRVAHQFMPVFNRDLTGHQRGPTAGAFLDDFQQVAPFTIAERSQPPVIKDK